LVTRIGCVSSKIGFTDWLFALAELELLVLLSQSQYVSELIRILDKNYSDPHGCPKSIRAEAEVATPAKSPVFFKKLQFENLS
jgi:hypothetical protein